MKAQILSLICLLFLLTPVKSETVASATQRNIDGSAGQYQRVRMRSSILERIQNLGDLSPWQILRERRQRAMWRLQSSTSGVSSFGAAPITNPIFFIPPPRASGGRFAVSVAVGDFNGDGRPDLAVVNECHNIACKTGAVGVLLGNGDGTYQPAVSYDSAGYFPESVAVADFNRDGRLDLAVAECPDPNCTNGVVSVLLGNGDGTFQPAVRYPGGEFAASLAAGDVNGDGKLDLVVVNGQRSIGVLLGNGDGTFQSVVTSPSGGRNPGPISLADFNQDGRLDLAEVDNGDCRSNADPCTSSVRILLGNGNGSFQATAVSHSSRGRGAVSVAVEDFNGDGNLDLAVLDSCSPSLSEGCVNGPVSILLGNGDGTLKAATRAAVFQLPTSLAIGDFNGDGKPDLAVTQEFTDINSDGAVTILLGNGNGAFHIGTTYDSGGAESFFGAVGDFNGDGKADLVVSSLCLSGSNCTRGSVVGLLGNGNGTFRAPVGYSSGSDFADAVATADFNHDGRPDLVVAGDPKSCVAFPCASSLTVRLGQADGTLKVATATYATGGFHATSVAVGDFNGDGKPDVAVAHQCADSSCAAGSAGVLLGKGNGTFQAPVSYASGGPATTSVAVGDFNRDGKLDLAVANNCTNSNCDGSVSVLLGRGDGTFSTAVSYPSGGREAAWVAVGDFNRDGTPDLVVANGDCDANLCPLGSVGVLLGNGDGTFEPAVTYSSGGENPSSVAVGDFNRDGKLDLAVSNSCNFLIDCIPGGSVAVLLGNGDGTFQAATTYPTGNLPANVAVQDLNGDGKLDLVLSSRQVLLGNGDGTFQTARLYDSSGGNVTTVEAPSEVVADFNGDGKPDLVVALSDQVTVLLNIASHFHYPTSTAVTSSINPASLRQIVKFTATVTPVFTGRTMTSTVTFSDGGHALASVPVSNGQAAFSTSSLVVGAHAITATYHGDENFLPSTSAVLAQTIGEDATGTNLTSSSNPSTFGQSVTLTALVGGQFGGVPTGSVSFRDGTTPLAAVLLKGGQGKFSTSALSIGKHTITASYGGDGRFLPSTSTKLAQVVKNAATSAELVSQIVSTALNANGQESKYSTQVHAVIQVRKGSVIPSLSPR